MRTKILVVDDEESLCEILKFNLEKEGYDVETAYSAEEALQKDLPSFQLVISDIMMDNLSGFDLVKRMRYNPATEHIPIILCTALDNEDNIVMGLNIGADDYITKPFVKAEVIARVRAILRRIKEKAVVETHEPEKGSETDISFKNLRLDQNLKACFINNVELPLTPTEYKILYFFLTHRNKFYSREEIINEVWGRFVQGRAVDANITRLRGKLGEFGEYLQTRTGFGYAFKDTI